MSGYTICLLEDNGLAVLDEHALSGSGHLLALQVTPYTVAVSVDDVEDAVGNRDVGHRRCVGLLNGEGIKLGVGHLAMDAVNGLQEREYTVGHRVVGTLDQCSSVGLLPGEDGSRLTELGQCRQVDGAGGRRSVDGVWLLSLLLGEGCSVGEGLRCQRLQFVQLSRLKALPSTQMRRTAEGSVSEVRSLSRR